MRPTIDLEDAVGKRLDAVITDYTGILLLVFEGGDPVVLEADTSRDDEPIIEENGLHLVQWIRHPKELIDLGVITQDEVDKELDRQKQLRLQERVEKTMSEDKQHAENLGSSVGSVALWGDALEVLEAMQHEEPPIYFMDGNSLTGIEAWSKCLRVVLQRLRAKADKAPKNTVAIKMLPWMCGNCGKHEVQNLRVYEGGPSFIATCDHCGSEWVS